MFKGYYDHNVSNTGSGSTLPVEKKTSLQALKQKLLVKGYENDLAFFEDGQLVALVTEVTLLGWGGSLFTNSDKNHVKGFRVIIDDLKGGENFGTYVDQATALDALADELDVYYTE